MGLLVGQRMKFPRWVVPSYRALVIEIAFLIVFGGAVRVMNAGLACPDWPLCFGRYIPDYHPQVYFEFIHRVLAGTVTIITLGLSLVVFMSPQVSRVVKALAGVSLAVLAGQIVLGGLTVLLQLKSGVVAAHLAMGTAFFGVMLWISLELRERVSQVKVEPIVPAWAGFVAAAVYSQMLLGGLVASNYAGLACTEFPLCQGHFIPTLVGPVGMHVIHRLGAYTIAAIAMINVYVMKNQATYLRRQSRMMIFAVLVQIGLGVANVLFYTPPLLAVLHLAVGLKILYLALRQLHFASKAEVTVQSPAALPDGLS